MVAVALTYNHLPQRPQDTVTIQHERKHTPCPECGKDMVERRQKGRGGKVFYGCSGYPDCKFALNQRPLPQPCPECDEMLVVSGRENARCLTCKWKGARPETEEEAEESMEEVA